MTGTVVEGQAVSHGRPPGGLDNGWVWFSARTRFLVASVVMAAAAVAVGLLGGGWTVAVIAAVLIGLGAFRVLRLRRRDPDGYSTPQLWGKPPPG